MALSHDPDGFLSGPKVTRELDKIGRDIEVLKAIRKDTQLTVSKLSDIANALNGTVKRSPDPAVPRAPRATGTATEIEKAIRRGMAGTQAARAANDSQARQRSAPKAPRPDQPAVDRKRSANGRFGAGDDSPGGGSAGGESRAAQAMGAASESLRGAAEGLGNSADNIDPTVQAAKEVGGIVSPMLAMFKPLGRLFGRRQAPEEKRQRQNVQWYRRIVSAISGGGKAGGMGLIGTALLSMLGMLLAPIKALGRMLGAMRAIAALGGLLKGAGRLAGLRGGRGGAGGRGKLSGGRGPAGAPHAGGKNHSGAPGSVETRTKPGSAAGASTGSAGVGGKAKAAEAAAAKSAAKAGGKGILGKGLDLGKSMFGKAGGLAGGLGKGLLKKIPFIGAALGLGMAASTVMAADDPNATPDEKKQAKAEKWGAVGGAVGGIVGGIGGMIGGPAGAIVGGMVGDYVGTKVGEWLSTVDLGSLVSTVSDAFTGLGDMVGKGAAAAFDFLKGAWGDMVGKGAAALSSLTDWAKEKWDAAGELVDGVKESVGNGVTAVKDAGQNVLNTVTGGRYSGGSNAAKDEMIKAMDAGGITDPKSKAMLMANADHESGGFTKKEENLNYSAKRLQEVFPKYYSNPEDAARDAKNPEAIANKVYGGRMGNTEAGDGFKYRGRGSLQLTGRAQYAAMGKQLGVDLENNPDLAMDPKISAKIAVAHWKSSGADRAASAGDVKRARQLTNGGTNGLDDVTKKYEEKYLAQAQAGDLTPTRQANEVRVAAPTAASGAITGTMAAIKAAGASPAVAGAPGAAPALAGGVQPVGIMAMSPTNASTGAPGSAPPGAAMRVASAAPASMPNLVTPSYTAPAADAGKTSIPSTPQVTKPNVAGGKDSSAAQGKMMIPLTQNLEDRQIAHAANGGIGMQRL
ncbi:glycoside hydrolase family 19 protein [Pseudomonas lurida]|uniref:glycoside hydrolase family 19 protein n=1 Tax=Pseudomonas lurida TaxID=244566 RepID=UPI00177DB17A|nr:glycoside hydrolase family 19 protein [Pseudomonas lurida]MBD8671615.1 hypothetical protein [Pseudomonas lurida]